MDEMTPFLSMKSSSKMSLVFIALVFIAVLSVSMIIVSDDSDADATTFIADGIKYEITSESTVSVISNSYSGDIVIPSSVEFDGDSYSVTAIGNYAFKGCSSLISVVIGKNVTSIGFSAFNGCTSLNSVEIGENVRSIGTLAFSACNTLCSIVIPDSVETIGDSAFMNCTSLRSVKIGDEVTSIGDNAFMYCYSMESLTIGNSVETIGYMAFYSCTSLKSVSIPDSVKSLDDYSFSACLSLVSADIGKGVVSIPLFAFSACTSLRSLMLADGIKSIEMFAFDSCSSLTSVLIPASMESIDENAFHSCSSLNNISVSENNLNYCSENGVLFNKSKNTLIKYPANKSGSSYTIPDTVTYISAYAFDKCRYLKHIDIGDQVGTIGECAFLDCISLRSIEIPDTVTEVGAMSFTCCTSLEYIYLGSGVTSLGESSFDLCRSLKEIEVSADNTSYVSVDGVLFNKTKTVLIKYPEKKEGDTYHIPDSVTTIAPGAFMYSGLKTIDGGENVTSIGTYAFSYNIYLKQISLGSGIRTIGDSTFFGCSSMKSFSFGDELETIGIQAFSGCSSLVSVILPKSLNDIGNGAFDGCISITEFEVSEDNSTYSSDGGVLFNKNRTLLIYYPAAKESVSYTIPNTVTSVNSNAFDSCMFLSSLIIGSGVSGSDISYAENIASISEYVVSEDNKSLSSDNGVLFNKDKTTLLRYPMAKTDLSYVVPDSVTTIDQSAFMSNHFLNYVVLPEGLKVIATGAFQDCIAMKTVSIPNSVTSFSLGLTFVGCSSLTSVTIGDNSAIGTYSFTGCTSLTEFIVSENNVRYCTVDGVLFTKDKTKLVAYPAGKTDATYTIPDSVTGIYNGAFAFVKYLSKLIISENVQDIPDTAFVSSDSLEEFTVSAGNEWYCSENGVLFSKDKTVLIQYPSAKGDAAYTIPDTVETIRQYAFIFCKNLTEIIVSENSKGFSTADGVLFNKERTILICYPSGKTDTSYTVPYTVTEIGTLAFSGCVHLTSVMIGDCVITIDSSAFYDNDSITYIGIPVSVISIEDEAFIDYIFCDSDGVLPIKTDCLPGYAYSMDPSSGIMVRQNLENIRFDENGGSEKIDGMYTTEGDKFILPDYEGTKTGHEFGGWSYGGEIYQAGSELTKVYGDMTFTAVWDLTKHYAVFMNGEEEYSRTQYDYGSVISMPDGIPAKSSTAQYDYTFSHWNGFTEGMVITADISFDAVYDAKVRSYSIVFISEGKVYSQNTMLYGTEIIKPAQDPEKASTEKYRYAFIGWSGYSEGMTVDGDKVFNAQFDEILREYTITFMDEGKVYESYKKGYGLVITLPSNPAKAGTETYDYRFVSWVGYTHGMTVSGDATFTSSYEAVLKSVDTSGEKVVIDVKDINDVKAPSEVVDKIRQAGNDGKSTEITLSKGKISLDSASAAGLPDGPQTISFNETDRSKIPEGIKEKIGDRPVYSISIGDVHEFSGTLTISVKYDLKDGEKAENVCIWYIKSDGSYEKLSCKYSEGYATFTTTHLSEYAVMTEQPQPSSSGDSNIGIIIGGAVAALAVIGLIVFFVVRKKQ